VIGGASAGAEAGSAYGSGIFVEGDKSLTFKPSTGVTQTIRDVIADQKGSEYVDPAQPGAGSLVLDGPGVLLLAAANTFTGGVRIEQGVLELGGAGSAGSGAITFTDGVEHLKLDFTPTNGFAFANTLTGVGAGDTIDLEGLAWSAGATATSAGATLNVVSAGVTEQFTVSAGYVWFDATTDGAGGVLLTARPIELVDSSGIVGQAVVSTSNCHPFGDFAAHDDPGATDTLTITASDYGFTLRDGAGVALSHGPYTLIGSASDITSQLQALHIEPVAAEAAAPLTFTLNFASSTGFATSLTKAMSVLPSSYSVATAAELNTAIQHINAASLVDGASINYTITLAAGTTLTESATLAAIELAGDDILTIDGAGATLDGANLYRGLFASSGEVHISNLTIAHARATGGAGGSSYYGGGGGAGLGGGLYVGASADVTLSGVTFSSDSAAGGAGGVGAGGGAGFDQLGGDGGDEADLPGFGAGGLGQTLTAPNGTAGGYGAGGGAQGGIGGAGGFGGGGGGSYWQGGAGGFGGGAGGTGADGGAGGGGGGLGAGGAVFVQSGGVLTIGGATLSGSAAAGGAGGSGWSPGGGVGSYGNGAAGGGFGAGVFLQGGQTLAFAPGAARSRGSTTSSPTRRDPAARAPTPAWAGS
jgi:large repetitive protein